MESTIKDRLAMALAKLQAGTLKLKQFKAYKISSDKSELDEFCSCALDVFDGCAILETIINSCKRGTNDGNQRA